MEYVKEENDPDEIQFVKEGDHAKFGKGMSTDPLLYSKIKDMAESDQFVDIKMPDFSNVPTLRTKLAKVQQTAKEEQEKQEPVDVSPDDFEPVNAAEVFGGGPFE